MVDCHQLSDCNKSTRATPFRSGFTVNSIPPSSLDNATQLPLTKNFQQILGDLNWLSISTRPDISTIVSLLAAHSHRPSPAHRDAARHIINYLASMTTLGLYYTSDNTESPHAYVHFPPKDNTLAAFSDANWGPMDVSVPKPSSRPIEQAPSSLRSLSGWLVLHSNSPIAWGSARHKDTAQSSCQAEFHSINETTKLILEFHLLFRDINLPLTTPSFIKNDNQGAALWAKGTTSKKMRWVDLRENLIRENIQHKNISDTHIPGKLNLAGLFTKEFRDVNLFLSLRNSFMIAADVFSSGGIPVPLVEKPTYKDALTNPP